MEMLYSEIYLNQCDELNSLHELNINLNNEQKEIELTDNLKTNEILLENYLLEIRSKWISSNFKKSYEIFRSPVKYSKLDKEKFNNFEYERILFDSPLENINFYNNQDYDCYTYIYSSGMAAINCTLFTIKSLFSKKINLASKTGYFETQNILELYKRMGINRNKSYKNVDDNQIYIYEPIQYNFVQQKYDYFTDLLKLKNQRNYTFIIIDISLFGETYKVENILDTFKNNDKVIIIILESLLKLSQRGMELTNAGRSRWYIPKSNFLKKNLTDRIKLVRDLTGSNISNSNALLLNSIYLLDNYNYSFEIQKNNKDLYHSIKYTSNRIIKEIYYSSDSQVSEISMPFIFIEFHDTSEYFSEMFLKYLNSYYSQYNLSIDIRDSFGFLNISCQYFIDRINDHATFKIACGHLKGFKYFIMQQAILETDSFESIEDFLSFQSKEL